MTWNPKWKTDNNESAGQMNKVMNQEHKSKCDPDLTQIL